VVLFFDKAADVTKNDRIGRYSKLRANGFPIKTLMEGGKVNASVMNTPSWVAAPSVAKQGRRCFVRGAEPARGVAADQEFHQVNVKAADRARRAFGRAGIPVRTHYSGWYARQTRHEDHESSVVIDMAMHNVIRTIETLYARQGSKLPEQVPVTATDVNLRSAPNDVSVVRSRLVAVHKEVNGDLTPIHLVKDVDQPGLRSTAIKSADHL
jgi:hypothetical protein